MRPNSRYFLPVLLLLMMAPFQNCGGKTKAGEQKSSSSSAVPGRILCPDSFCASYYDDMDKSGNYIERMDAYPLDFDWGNGSPDPDIDADTFAGYWLGSFQFAAGTYTFSATADDGVRVIVDGQVIIDAFFDQGPTLYQATKTLSAGYHQIEVEYYENGGGAVMKLSWQ